jgi:hypothetical protein
MRSSGWALPKQYSIRKSAVSRWEEITERREGLTQSVFRDRPDAGD